MSMDLEKKTFIYEPEYLIAGVDIGITTAVKEAAADLPKGAPVLLDSNGKAAPVEATTENDETTVDVTGLYGITADSAESGEDAVIYLTGEFFADKLALGEGVTAADLEVPFRNIGIFLK